MTAEPAQNQLILQVQNVTKRFGGLLAVSEVGFDLPQGQILGVIGPNGAGKTTLFNVINGVYPPTEGRVIFRDADISGWQPYDIARLGLARTHQIVRPLNELSVLENVMVGACYGHERRSLGQAREIAEEVLRVDPNLVVMADGEVQTVRYHFLAPLLVAEVQRLEHARAGLEEQLRLQREETGALGRQVAELKAMLATLAERVR